MSDKPDYLDIIIEQDRKLAELKGQVNDFLALARRVHAECGPELWPGDGEEVWACRGCYSNACDVDALTHKPDCLWLAADKMKKEGLI